MRCRWDLRVALGTKSDLRWMLSKNQMISWPLGKLSDEGSCGNGFSCLSVHCPKIHLCTCAGEDTALNSKCFLGAMVSPVVRLQGGRISRVVFNTLQVQGAILALCPRGPSLLSCLCVTLRNSTHLSSVFKLSAGGHFVLGVSWLLWVGRRSARPRHPFWCWNAEWVLAWKLVVWECDFESLVKVGIELSQWEKTGRKQLVPPSTHCASDTYILNSYNDPVRLCNDYYCHCHRI